MYILTNSTRKGLLLFILHFACNLATGNLLSAQSVTFSLPGTTTWTVPSGINTISVEAWGGGGGGSKGFSNLKGTGGGGGGFATGTLAVNPGDVITIKVGAGGIGATTSGNGFDGGESEVTLSANSLIAEGGSGGISDALPSGTGGAGGSGSFTGAWTNTTFYCGGYGANLTSPTSPTPGGGAGGGAGQSGNGKNAGNGTSNCFSGGGGPTGGAATGFGGAGGNGGTSNTTGSAGSTRGGGGGGNAGTGFGGNGANGYVSILYYASAVLPVELALFEATPDECNSQLTWVTASEKDFSHFEVERSLDGHDFTVLGLVQGLDKADGAAYSFSDITIKSNAYYRLKMVDKDGEFAYSKIVENANNCRGKSISIYPNPVQIGQPFSLNIEGYKADENEIIQGQLIAASGKVIKVLNLNEGMNQVALEGLPSGSYWLRLVDETGLTSFQRLVVVE